MVLQNLNVCCNTRIDIYLAKRVGVKAVVITLPQIHKNGNLTAYKFAYGAPTLQVRILSSRL